MRVFVAIPHYFRSSSSREDSNDGYGSQRSDKRFVRINSFYRCLSNLAALARSQQDFVLNIANKNIEIVQSANNPASDIEISINIFSNQHDILSEVIDENSFMINNHLARCESPKQIPLAAVYSLLFDASDTYDYYIYMEDDLSINNQLFVHFVDWFYSSTDYQYILMPHRYEATEANAPKRLYVDGPINSDQYFVSSIVNSEPIVLKGIYKNENIGFVEASNPHSGMLILSNSQRKRWQALGHPRNLLVLLRLLPLALF